MNRELVKRARHRLFAEKSLIELAILVGVAGVCLLAAPLMIGQDPLGATTFTSGGPGRVILVAVAAMVVAVICGALTAAARPAAVAAAVLVGLGGLSLHSAPLRTLLWRHHDALPALYVTLMIELLIGTLLVGIAMIVGEFVRRVVGARMGRLAWQDPLEAAGIPPAECPEVDYAYLTERRGTWATIAWAVTSPFRRTGRAGSPGLKHRALCSVVMVVGGAVLLAIFCRTEQRNQVLFALFAGFAVAAMVAHQLFPTACSTIFWVSPIIVGLAVYALAASAGQSLGDSVIGWVDVPYLARALPID